MRSTLVAAALLGFAAAAPAPAPQSQLDPAVFAQIEAAQATAVTGPPVTATAASSVVEINTAAVLASASAQATATPTVSSSDNKRDLFARQGGTCAPQPTGSGPTPSPDTAQAFLDDSDFDNDASNAPTPDGYAEAFCNLQSSVSGPGYLGYYILQSYDTLTCQEYCDAATGCYGFNVFVERDPSVDPGANCPNPASTTNYKCTLWGNQVSSSTATNNGQYRDQFQVVIAGSNGYNKLAPPPSQPGYDGPTELGGAINAPSGYIGYNFFPGAYDPSQCTAACNAQTNYDHQHPNSDGTYDPCNFVNAYVLSKNGVPQGTYCSKYTQAWGKQYATNVGYTSGSDRYTVSQSYGYTLDPADPGHV